ncbi:hypothetical protein COCCADRAFT_33496 [Bipolaris zeicola 26-R-13]|uniref:Uncharacterized protein n=1 Tax=Cochliobolus carbonum (strain 26-R-13) TaxID=930089 RepID=W6Z0L0_COCC2|nr:uncharacterized protein COCCADRAFT_33496 [Bipolaris zeicola 26-R-13]EUC37226.1 hypothetical protein COCCADRAFT_33496 [Bipolaris zeicola 26-R-13]
MKCPCLHHALDYMLHDRRHYAHHRREAKHVSSTQLPTARDRLSTVADRHHGHSRTPRGELKTQPRHGRLPISRLEMSEAWMRIRAVTPIPAIPPQPASCTDSTYSTDSIDSTYPTDSTGSTRCTSSHQDHDSRGEKKVRWGVVHTREFDPPPEDNDEQPSNKADAKPR